MAAIGNESEFIPLKYLTGIFKKQIHLSPKIKLLPVILQVLCFLTFFLSCESMMTHLHETWEIQKNFLSR